MKRKFQIFFSIGLTFVLFSYTPKGALQNGIWRGVLSVADNKVAPFLFEVSDAQTDSTTVTLLNGDERVKLPGVAFHGDTLVIPIEAYDAVIKGFVGKDKINGKFIKNYLENDSGITFSAQFGQKNRFVPAQKPSPEKIDGKWNMLFISEKGDTARNVGIFKSYDGIVTGSVLTNSGDLRFLEGAYTESGVKLSAFSGLSPYLIELNFRNDSVFDGKFYTSRGTTQIDGKRNDRAELADPYSLAGLKPGYKSLGFRLPNLEGKTVSLQDERYKGKVVVVSILGSWCPNCLDEMAYLSPWYNENKPRGVELVGIAFERKNDFNYARQALARLKNRYAVHYEILFGGEVGKENVDKALPEIENFSGYPTTVFIDKRGVVRKIHTGFNGPATGLFHEEFKNDFNKLIDNLLTE